MRGEVAVGIKPHLARTKQKAGIADIMDRLHLLGADAALDPDEFAMTGEILLQPVAVEIGEDLHQLVHGAQRVDHHRRLRIERVGQQVGRKHPALAVDDVGALGVDLLGRGIGLRLFGARGGEGAHA